MNQQPTYDAVIVGARAAGAGLAAFMAKAGCRVLLLDRATFPKPTLSCPVFFSNTLEILRRLGVLERVEQLGAPRLSLYRVELGDFYLHGRMLPYRGLDYAYAIRREPFDSLMFDYVASLPGVEAQLGFNVSELIWEDGRVVGVRGGIGGKTDEEIRAEMVVGADGVYSTIAQQVSATRYNVLPARNAIYYAYYSNVKLAGGEPGASIYYHPDDMFAVVTSESDGDLTAFSISVPADKFEETRRNVETIHAAYSGRIPELAERLSGARRETKVYGVTPRESFYRIPYGAGWVLIGDAGYYKDPLTGQGIHDGLRSAELVTQAYLEFKSKGSTPAAWSRAMDKYRLTRDRETRGMYWLTDYFADLTRTRVPTELELFRAIAAMPDWSDRYVSLFNGVTNVDLFRRLPNQLYLLATYHWRRARGRISTLQPDRAKSQKRTAPGRL